MDCNIVGTMEKWQIEKQKLFWIQANQANAYFNCFQYLLTDRSLPDAIFHFMRYCRVGGIKWARGAIAYQILTELEEKLVPLEELVLLSTPIRFSDLLPALLFIKESKKRNHRRGGAYVDSDIFFN